MGQERFLATGLLFCTFLTSISAVVAQPVTPVPALDPNAPVQQPLAPPMSLADLEKLIGGRTTLELNFKNATAEETTALLAKSSGLRFGPPQTASGFRTVSAGTGADAMEAPRYDGTVPKMEFWPALRLWSRAEAARLKSEGETARRRLDEERPGAPQAEAGQPVTAEAQNAWQAQMREWSRRQSQQMQRFSFNRGVSVRFDRNVGTWSLSPGDEIARGRALNTWPCFILATGFQRSQNLSIQENEPQEKAPEEVQKKAGDNVAQDTQRNSNGTEVIGGGQLTDGLSLNLSLFIDPKLLGRARVRVLMSSARDDAGEELLSEREQSGSAASSGMMRSSSSGMSGSGMQRQVEFRPRQSKGKKLALLRGVVIFRYPLQTHEHELTDFNGPRDFMVGSAALPASAQLEPPRIENGSLRFSASVTLNSDRGGRAILNSLSNRVGRGATGDGVLGEYLLPDPSRFTFTDTQGRTWRANSGGGSTSLKGPGGQVLPITSPPKPPPDDFTYTEERTGYLTLAPSTAPTPAASSPPRLTITPSILNRTGNATYVGSSSAPQLSSEELAKVRFTKAVFTTESDWRTLEVPFEFRDLPLPPR